MNVEENEKQSKCKESFINLDICLQYDAVEYEQEGRNWQYTTNVVLPSSSLNSSTMQKTTLFLNLIENYLRFETLK